MLRRVPLVAVARRIAVPFAACAVASLAACSAPPVDSARDGEGEGEGAPSGEGEGEGVVVIAEGEGEGALFGEGEGEGALFGEGEGEGVVVIAEGEGEGAASTTWRSALYPSDWTPAFTDASGRFLHDFSYAGFGLGDDVPDVDGPLFPVDAGAGAGTSDATAAIQQAIDAASASGGGVVVLGAGTFRIDGTLHVRHDDVVVRGAGIDQTRLRLTRADLAFGAQLTIGTATTTDGEVLLVQDAPARTVELRVADASALHPGDDVVVGQQISPAFVADHGMSGVWGPFNDTWQVFARRTIVDVDTSVIPHVVTLDVPLRQAVVVRDAASVRVQHGLLARVGVEHLSFTSAVDETAARAIDQNHAIALQGVKDAWVRHVRSFASVGAAHVQSGGVLVYDSKRVTIDDVQIGRAQNRGDGGNGYLFELSQSNEVLVQDSVGLDGRHNFIQNWGFGTSGCVFRRITSRGSTAVSTFLGIDVPLPASSEFHHSLATANLIEDSVLDDGFIGANRGTESSGAGHAASENVFWNVRGAGTIRSLQYGNGYVIGADVGNVVTSLSFVSPGTSAQGTAPEDFVEGRGQGSALSPSCLSCDQRTLRGP